MKFSSELYKDLKQCYDFDPSTVEAWSGDYEYKWSNFETGEVGGIYLSECISF